MRLFLLLLLCSCVACPSGTIPVNQTTGLACISQISYCTTDSDCTTAKFSCEQPCENLPVNVQNLEKAKTKEQSCNRENASCRLSPEIVQMWCEEHLCRTRTLYAEDFVTTPKIIPTHNNTIACYSSENGTTQLHLSIINEAITPLETLDALIIGNKKTNSNVTPFEFALIPLIEKPVPENTSREIIIPLPKNIGDPTEIALYPSQRIIFGNVDTGIVTKRVSPLRIQNITACPTSTSGNRRV